jgi:hypothetical protein
MKTRTLFLTLLTAISILLITNSSAFSQTFTGCLKPNGKLIRVKVGTEPLKPCKGKWVEVSWDSPMIDQVQLPDSNSATCEAAPFPMGPNPDTYGWCPNGTRTAFIIPDPIIIDGSVVMAHMGGVPNPAPFPNCVVRFINPNLTPTSGGFNFNCDAPIPNGVPLNYVVINP